MGYGEVLLGNAIRGKLIENRRERWRDRLTTEHDLSATELETLDPYVEYVCHFGSWKELAGLVVLFLPFALISGAILMFSGGFTFTVLAAVATGSETGPFLLVAAIAALIALFALLLLGAIGYFLYTRSRRYRLASEIEAHLATDPRRLAAGEVSLPKSREEIATANDATTVTSSSEDHTTNDATTATLSSEDHTTNDATTATPSSDEQRGESATSSLIRSNAVAYERHLIYFATINGVLALFGGLIITLSGVVITLNPLDNPTGRSGVILLVYGIPYMAAAIVLARTRSTLTWGFLMLVFVVGSVTAAVLLTPEALLTGLVGLYIGYRAARDGDYDVPGIASTSA